jgi:hypothetical protein
MSEGETNLEKARRHVAEAEQRIARQQVLIDGLVRDRHTGRIIDRAHQTLHLMQENMRVLRQHLELELERSLTLPQKPGT